MPHGDFLVCFRALREEEVQEGELEDAGGRQEVSGRQ